MSTPSSQAVAPKRLELFKASHYFVTFFVLALFPAVLGPTLSELASQTNSALRDVSLLFSMRSLGYLCSARLIGAVFDSRPGHPVMAIALLCTAGFIAFLPFLDALWMLAVAVLGIGIGGAFVDLGGNILLVRAFKQRPGPVLNGLHFSFGVGAVTAPLLVALALSVTGSTVDAYFMIAMMSLPVAGWMLRLPSPETPVLATGRSTERASRSASILLVVGFFFLYGGAEVSFGGWIHTYGVARNAMGAATAAYLTSGFWAALTLGRLLSIPLALRFRPEQLILTQLAGCIVVLFLLLANPPSATLTWGCTLAMGLCLSSIFPLMMAFLEPFTSGSGRMTSWFFVGASSGSMSIPWLIGQFIEELGPQIFVAAVLACVTLGTAIVFRMSR